MPPARTKTSKRHFISEDSEIEAELASMQEESKQEQEPPNKKRKINPEIDESKQDLDEIISALSQETKESLTNMIVLSQAEVKHKATHYEVKKFLKLTAHTVSRTIFGLN